MDYAESLAYWYLRLNGFFPITNFVLHRPYGKGQNTDCDVLGVHPVFVQETISNDVGVVRCASDLFKKVNVCLDKDTVGVIGQVKSGAYSVEEVESAFDKERLFYSVHRLGLLPPAEVDGAVAELQAAPVARRGNVVILKLLVDTSTHRRKAEAKAKRKGAWLEITLEEIDTFIRDRFNDYKKHKSGARMFFHDPLTQYLAWKCNLEDEDEDVAED
jgi:hypothetical protein